MNAPMNTEGLSGGLPPANDRMLTTCFLRGPGARHRDLGRDFLLARGDADKSDGPALEVVLVNEQTPSVAQNPNARYLAQRSQLGSGNTLKTSVPSSPAPR